MTGESRTSKSIKNAKVALAFYFINLVLQFLSRKVFLDYLGAEVLGLNTTAQNLLGFLNLAELGVSFAISYTLYAPLLRKDEQTINEIVSLQGWLYRRIAYIIICGAVVLMCFFPWMFAKADVPFWYAYATFTVLLCSSLFGYFWNYRQIVLTADQQEYKVTFNIEGCKLLKIALQLVLIAYLPYGYISWLVLEFLAAVVTVRLVNRLLKRTYPWLKTDISRGGELKLRYPQIMAKTKQLFFHKIGGFVLTQTSPLIVYAFSSLTLVAIYGNYLLLIAGISRFLDAVFNSIGAGVGNLVSEGDKKKIWGVFLELFSSRFLLVSTACYSVYILTSDFITLWVGEQYLLDNITLLLLIAIMYVNLMRTVVDVFINAYGLFQDVWATLTEAGLNVGMSVLLGYFYGLHGILCGVLLSLILIIFMWKPYFLFRDGMKMSITKYIGVYCRCLCIGVMTWACVDWVRPDIEVEGWLDWGVAAVVTAGLFFVFELLLLCCFDKSMRRFIQRFLKLF